MTADFSIQREGNSVVIRDAKGLVLGQTGNTPEANNVIFALAVNKALVSGRSCEIEFYDDCLVIAVVSLNSADNPSPRAIKV